MQDAELLHRTAKALAEAEGITEDKAIQTIRDGFTLNSELHTKIPMLQAQYPTQPPHSSLEATANLLAKGSAQSDAAKAGLQTSALEMRRIELEERRLEMEQKSLDAAQRREDTATLERKDALIMQQDRLAFEREQMRIDAKNKSDELKLERDLRRDELKLERETSRGDQKFSQILALGQGNGTEEYLKMIETQSNSQREYFKEINTVKDNERNHTDQLRTDLAKIESDRDVELVKLKAGSDQSTADAIDALVIKMDENFEGMMKSPSDDGEDFLDKYNKQIEKVNKFQKNLTAAGLKTLQSQGVDVDALKKAHNIATDSEESTLDKIIGVGKDLYEKTIKPGMEEAAKNVSGSGTNAPSGLETAFEAPDTEMEDRIRAEQQSQEQDNQLALQENVALKMELKQYENALYDKAMQHGIPTHGLSIEEIESMINQYETIMSKPFNSAPQTKSISGMRQIALELKINTSGKTVAQVEAEVIQAQQKIEQQLDELPDYVLGQESGSESDETQKSPPIEEQEPDLTPRLPDETQDSLLTEEQEPDHAQKPPDRKRSITAKRGSYKKKPIKFTTSDGTEIEAKTPLSAATKLAKELRGTAESPAKVELTDEDGKKYSYETRVDQVTRHGNIIDMPRAKKIST